MWSSSVYSWHQPWGELTCAGVDWCARVLVHGQVRMDGWWVGWGGWAQVSVRLTIHACTHCIGPQTRKELLAFLDRYDAPIPRLSCWS